MKEVKISNKLGGDNMRAFPFPDKIMSREEMERDLLYKKIPKSDLERISDKAWDTGVEAARSLLKEYGCNKRMEEIAKISGLTVERINKDNIVGNVRYFSEYYSGRNKIVLYLDSIVKWAKANNREMHDAEELILSHEYFHFLECKKLGLTSKQYKIPTISIGSIAIGKSGIRALSEIGAHGFSRTFYELNGKIKCVEMVEKKNLLINQAISTVEFDSKRIVEKIFTSKYKNMFKQKCERR